MTLTRRMVHHRHPVEDTTHPRWQGIHEGERPITAAPPAASAGASSTGGSGVPFGRPPEWDLLKWLPSPYDQLGFGACGPNMLDGMLGFAENLAGHGFPMYSRMAIYNYCDQLMGTPGADNGVTNAILMEVPVRFGVILESEYAYTAANLKSMPSAALMAKAKTFDASQFVLVGHRPDPEAIADVICSGYPVGCGFDVFPGMMPEMVPGLLTATSGVLPMPDARSNGMVGGHDILIVGYRYWRGRLWFLVRNNWGTRWALSGYFWMPADYVAQYGFDAYFVRPVKLAEPFQVQTFPVPDVTPQAVPAVAIVEEPVPSIYGGDLPWHGTISFASVPSVATGPFAATVVAMGLPDGAKVCVGLDLDHPPLESGQENIQATQWFEASPGDGPGLYTATIEPWGNSPEGASLELHAVVCPADTQLDWAGNPTLSQTTGPYPQTWHDDSLAISGMPDVVPILTPQVVDVQPRGAAPGQPVTISGSGFDETSKVCFATTDAAGHITKVSARVKSVTAAQITAVVPQVSGTASITVEGCKDDALAISQTGGVTVFHAAT